MTARYTNRKSYHCSRRCSFNPNRLLLIMSFRAHWWLLIFSVQCRHHHVWRRNYTSTDVDSWVGKNKTNWQQHQGSFEFGLILPEFMLVVLQSRATSYLFHPPAGVVFWPRPAASQCTSTSRRLRLQWEMGEKASMLNDVGWRLGR